MSDGREHRKTDSKQGIVEKASGIEKCLMSS